MNLVFNLKLQRRPERRTLMRRRLLRSMSVLAAILPVAAAMPAQQENEPAASFAEVIDVRIVNVEIVVTDSEGNRVHGLAPADFELLVEGDITPIEYFTEVEDGVARTPPGGDVTGVPGLDASATVGTSFLIFIDDFFSTKRDRNRVLDGLGNDLREFLLPADHVAAVAFDGTSLVTLMPWTNEPRQWEEALDRARERSAYGLHRLGELRMNDSDRELGAHLEAVTNQEPLRDQVEELASLDSLKSSPFRDKSDVAVAKDIERLREQDKSLSKRTRTSLTTLELQYAENLEDQLRRSVMATLATMRRFANRPGRKVMLLLAGGWPRSPALHAVADAAGNAHNLSVPADGLLMSEDELYGPLVSTANLIGWSLYPVDVPGARADFSGDASRPSGAVQTPDQQSRAGALNREALIESTLELLARSTGGLPLINSQRDSALARAFKDTRSYYWLGFRSRRRQDEAFHEVTVRLLDRKGLRLRAREGYVDLSSDREIGLTAEAALMFADAPGARPLEARLSQPVRAGRGRMSLHVEIAIPLDKIQLLPIAGTWRNELEFRAMAMDMNGNRSEMAAETIRIEGPAKPRPGQTFFYETDLQLRRREHRYVMAIHDPLTGTILTAAGKIHSP